MWGSPCASEMSGNGWPPTDIAGTRKATLVQRVKEIQKRGESHKQAWYSFCAEHGSTSYDPDRHDESILQDFLKSAEATMGGGKGKGGKNPWGSANDWNTWDGWSDPMSSWDWGGTGTSWWDMMMAMMWGMGVAKGFNGGKGGKGGKGGSDGKGGFAGMGGSDWGMLTMGDMEGKAGKGSRGGKGDGMNKTDASLFGGKPGDWVCSGCWNVNFSHRDRCNSCGAASRTEFRLGMKPGDWICPKCGDLVFATKGQCKMCGTPKPEERPSDFGSGDQDMNYYGSKGGWGKSSRSSPY
uniref:RanBP2-type domain-containing protein n=1 Tax=Alexandrium catenella TaxID=2925 RepID=A0A7S1S067_ALECA|mmetsp:Transcript_80020/g.212404  ORF Transcript_80020/g.212404 Transcript_80020/m.212404 type:complete len:295 (+) Transcript_80020:77-961(+)